MKKLFLMRHAKSSWEYADIADHDRPLNEKGISDAYKMANYLLIHKIKPDLIICSPSVRTLSTSKIVIETIQCGYEKLKIEPEIYESNADRILSIIQQTLTNINTLMIIGHEPSLTNFCIQLVNSDFQKIPTASFVCIEADIKSWKYLNTENSIFLQLLKASDLK